jgi:hypothetical protein
MLLHNIPQFYHQHRRNYRSEKDHALVTAILEFMVSFGGAGGGFPTCNFKAVGLMIKLSSYLQKTKNYEPCHYEISLILL